MSRQHRLGGRLAGRVAAQVKVAERRQRAAAQSGGERGAALVGDLVVLKPEDLEATSDGSTPSVGGAAARCSRRR